jgi:flagellar L-ring protein precursor FlgH
MFEFSSLASAVMSPVSNRFRFRFPMHGAVAALAMLTGACTLIAPQPSIVQQPTTARPPQRDLAKNTSGAIYNPGYANRPLFEDLRPRNIGDIVTIVIAENVNATKSSGAQTSRTAAADFSPKTSPSFLAGLLNKVGIGMTGDNTFKSTGGANAQNTFSGTLTVTVTDVLPNGYLAVGGEKQLLINQGNEYVRFSGIVNPNSISSANTVASTQVADARIEYSAKGYINEAETMGWLQRAFQSVSPF